MNLNFFARVAFLNAAFFCGGAPTLVAQDFWERSEGVLASEPIVESTSGSQEEVQPTTWPGDDAELKQRADHAKRLANLKQLQQIEASVEALIPKVSPCIVSIGQTASGVIVKPTGIVITASHVTRRAGLVVMIRLQDGRTVKGVTLGSNAANDTSAIQLMDPGPWPYLKTVAPDYTAQAGQWCVAFGYPLNWPRDKPANARLGRVTGQYNGKIVTDCPIMGGDSGGALVDTNGNLLGINSSVRLDVTQNLHVPIARYREDWSFMMERRDVDIVTAKPVAAPVKIQPVNNAATVTQNLATKTKKKNGKPYLGIYGESAWNGVRIRDVRRASPAEKAGLKPEDVIQQIDGSSIESFAMLLKYLSDRSGGDKITVTVNRFGANMNIVLTLETR